jgi:hypothetical protein
LEQWTRPARCWTASPWSHDETARQPLPPLLIGLHWLTLLLLIAIYASMELRGIFPRAAPPTTA